MCVCVCVCVASAPQAFCQDEYCSEHEFCGDKRYAGTRCFCRAIFASKYRAIDALGTTSRTKKMCLKVFKH